MDLTYISIEEFLETFPGQDTAIIGSDASERIRGGAENEHLEGLGGDDRIRGRSGDDKLEGGDGCDRLFGGEGNDLVMGGEGNDKSFGGTGGDYIWDMAGDNKLFGGDGNDLLRAGAGRDKLFGGDDDDILYAGGGNDKLFGGSGNDIAYGEDGDDRLHGGDGDDELHGGAGNDRIRDGWGDDVITGGDGNDKIKIKFGNDEVDAGAGDDRIVIKSDSGEPIIAQDPTLAQYYPDEPLEDSDDIITGGEGADTFYFRLELDARAEIAAKHTDEKGVINWQAVAGENNNAHDHWVNGIGNDLVVDFNPDEDRLVIKGHTTQARVSQIDTNEDGVLDSTLIDLYSDQGGNGGAHDQDDLGYITLADVLLEQGDVQTDAGVFFGAHRTLDNLLEYAA